MLLYLSVGLNSWHICKQIFNRLGIIGFLNVAEVLFRTSSTCLPLSALKDTELYFGLEVLVYNSSMSSLLNFAGVNSLSRLWADYGW